LNDKSDPMFEGSKLSAFGEDVLNVCQEGNIAIVWQIENDLLLQKIFRNYTGKVLIKKTGQQAGLMSDNMKEMAKQKNVLLLVECNPEGKPEQLSELMDSIGVQKLHFSIMTENRDSNSDSDWANRLIQGLYENRMKRYNRNEVYKEMVKVLGENLKNFLK
jgi:hypothetical protein